MAYGFSVTAKDGAFTVTLVALSSRPGTLLVTDDGEAHVIIKIKDQPTYLKRIYVHSVERMIGLPKVEYIDIAGVDPKTGEERTERITP